MKGHQNIYPIVCKPWMHQALISCVSLVCIKNKKLRNKILQQIDDCIYILFYVSFIITFAMGDTIPKLDSLKL